MKLVACTSCHTQYDVRDLSVRAFACPCGATVEVRELRPVEAAALRCGACGAQVTSGAKGCEYCGATLARDPGEQSLICPECCARNAESARFCVACGVGFSPQPPPLGEDLPCPCCEKEMQRQNLGGISVHECATCHGLFAPGQSFDALVDRAIEMRRAKLASGRPTPPRVSGATLETSVRYRKCPVCTEFMHRANFRRSSGVIIDSCRAHGTWLDADELEQIVGFISSGGLAEADARDRARQADAEKQERIKTRLATLRDDSLYPAPQRSDAFECLLDLFRAVF